MTRLIQRFDALLLDMNGTLAFGHDRFTPEDEFLSAYAAAGGVMSAGQVRSLLARYLERMERLTTHPRHCRRIDPLPVMLSTLAPGLAHRTRELRAFEAAFAACECGHVPHGHLRAVKRLAETHRLGLVSNVYAAPHAVEAMLTAAGAAPLFETMIWSSRLGAAKPALETFEAALAALDLPPDRVLFIGDDPLRDVHAPKSLGMAAVWVAPPGAIYPTDLIPPDARTPCLTQVADLPARAARVE